MDQTVTIGGLVLVLLAIASFVVMFGGGFTVFAAGFSSNPGEANRVANRGCAVAALALAVFVFCLIRLL